MPFVSFDDQQDSGFIDFNKPTEAPKQDQGDFGRGFKESFQQLPQLGYGLMAGAGAALESAVGEGGIATGIKKAGVAGYQEWGNKIASQAKESDSFSASYDKAKEGDFGSMVDWLQHSLGYAAGQGVQMLATAGGGALIGKAALRSTAEKVASGLVAKEVAKIGVTDAVAGKSAEEITRIATQNVAAKLGEAAAIGGMAFGQEGGEIFGDLSTKSANENRSLTGGELAKALGATLAAGGLEFVGDKLGIDVMLGRSALLKPAAGMAGVSGRLARAGIAAAGAAPIEGATEYGQTLLEEYGKGNDAFSADARRQALDAAAQGAIGGVAMGGAGGAIHGQHIESQPVTGEKPRQALLLTNEPDPLISFPDGSVGRQSDVDAFIRSLPEDRRIEARARLFGYESQSVTAEDVLNQQSVDAAIAVANRAIQEDTPEFKAQKIAEIDAAWQSHLAEATARRDQEYAAAEQQRREADIPAMQAENANDQAAQAQALTSAQGFDEQQPTAIQLAFQQAQDMRAQRLAEAQQRATVKAKQNEANNGLGNLGLEQGGRLYESTGIGESQASGNAPSTASTLGEGRSDVRGPTGVTRGATENGSVGNEGIRQNFGLRSNGTSSERTLDGGVREATSGTGLPGTQANGAQAAVEKKAKAILDAAGVTGNERMEALRNIRSGQNTLEDLIDAHPPKQQGAASENVNTNAAVREVPNVTTGSAETTTPVQQVTTAGRKAITQPVQVEQASTKAPGVSDGASVPSSGKPVQPTPSLNEIKQQNQRVVPPRENTGRRADFASVEQQQSRLESEIAKAKENAAARSAPAGEVVERYLGQYGKGMSGSNARTEAAKRNASQSNIKWTVEPNEDLGYDRYEVVGRKAETPSKSEAPASGGMPAADVTKALTPLRAKWLGFNRINTVQSISDLPARLQERAQVDAKTEAIYDPETKSVHMIADNISDPARAAFSAAHEVIGHGGLRMLRDKSVNEALNFAGSNRFIKDLATAIQKDRGTKTAEIEEAVAELAAANETNDFESLKTRYGVEIPNGVRNGIRGVVGRVYDAVKRFLSSITGRPVAEVSNADVKAMIGQQRAAVEGKTAPREEAPATEEAKPMQSRAPAAGVEHIPEWAKNESPEVQAALRKSGAIFTEKTMRQKIDELRTGAMQKLRTGILDQFAPIEEKLGRIPYVLARMAKNADGTLEALMLYGRPHLDSDGGMLVDTTKKGFIETMQSLQGEHERFFSWLAGRRAEQLKKEGRENLFTNDDISALATLNKGTMKDGTSREAAYLRAQKDVADLNNSVLDVAEASGLIDKESRKIWQSDFYVPFYRVMEEGVTGPSVKSGLVNQKSIKKLKGGTNNLNDLTENMLRNWSTLLTASAKNRAARASLQEAVRIGIANEADETTIRQMGKAANTKAVSYMDEGRNRWHVVEDDQVLAAISALEFNGYNNQAMKVMAKFKNYLTKSVTASPLFKVRNLIRDSISAIGTSGLDYNPFVNIKRGAELLGNEDLRAQMVAGGGIFRFGTMMEGERGSHVKQLIDAGIHPDNILDTADKMKAFLGNLWDKYQEIGDIGENINRAALYKKLRDEGVSHLEASYEARDLMDFGLSGAWAGVRALNQILPFFNARLQGLYKLGRAYNDDPKRLGTVVAATMAIGLISLLAYKDDDDFKKRTDSDRANYWWFKVGNVAVRIPKPFEIGAAATAAENLLALGLDSDNTNIKRLGSQTMELINGQLAMNPIPQVFRPLVDVYANKDSFTGRPIENAALQKLKPEDRYTYNTSELARLLSKSGLFVDPISLVAGTGANQLSPVQIDSLIHGYFSGMGSLATSAVDGLLHHSVIDRGEALPATLKTFAGSFAETLPSNSSRYVDMLYTSAQDIEQTYASYRNAIKNGDIEKAKEIAREERSNIAKYHMVESLKKNETRINQQIQRTMNSKEMTGKQKEETIRRLRSEQDKIARVFATRG